MKSLVQSINEGAWGYRFDENDYYLDMRDKFVNDLITNISTLLKSNNANDLYAGVGMSIEFCTSLKEMIYPDDVRMLNSYVMKALKTIENDEEWINNWNEPELIRININNAKQQWNLIKKTI